MPFAQAHDRVAMISAAMGLGATKVVIDKRELHRTGSTYTIDTLRELRAELGEKVPLIWLIGSDAFAKIDTWQHWQLLFELTHFAVVTRAGEAPLTSVASPALAAVISRRTADAAQAQQDAAGKLVLLTLAPPKISSTQIRALLQKGESIRGLLPNTVCDYIEQHGLYLNAN